MKTVQWDSVSIKRSAGRVKDWLTSFDKFDDRCRRFKGFPRTWVKNWLTSLDKYDDRCRIFKGFPRTWVTTQDEGSQRWLCKMVSSRKFGVAAGGLACVLSVLNCKTRSAKIGLAYLMIFSSCLVIPKCNGESTEVVDVPLLMADEISDSEDDLESDDKNVVMESDENIGLVLESPDAIDLPGSEGTTESGSVDTIDSGIGSLSGSISIFEPSSDAKDLGPDSKQVGSDSKHAGSDSKHLGYGSNHLVSKDSRPKFISEVVDQDPTSSDYLFDFDALPLEILGRVLLNLSYEQVFQLKTVSRNVISLALSDRFQGSPSRKKPTLTSCFFFIDGGVLKWAGYDASAKEWRLLPPPTFLPVDCKPDPDLFKEFLVCSKGGLVCINFSKLPDRERLIVFNPLSQVWKELPPLNYRRNPVLMHMLVNPITMAYHVIVAGSSKSGHEDLSQITEVFDSCTGTWTRTGDVLGPPYALNEFQSGVYLNGKIFCIGFVEEDDQVGKGIITYDVKSATWSSTWIHLLPFFKSSIILQLVENNGQVYLFSERTTDQPATFEHWIDRVEWNFDPLKEEETKCECELVNVMKKKTTGGKSLEVYPEHMIVPHAEGQLCIMNAISHTGVVYDVRDLEEKSPDFPLEAPVGKAFRGDLGFFSLNPMSFTVEPRFSSKVEQALP